MACKSLPRHRKCLDYDRYMSALLVQVIFGRIANGGNDFFLWVFLRGNSPLKNYFNFAEHGTSYKRETLAGFTTFLAMAYILAVNPLILGDAGMDANAVFVATAIAAAIGSFIMGLWASIRSHWLQEWD